MRKYYLGIAFIWVLAAGIISIHYFGQAGKVEDVQRLEDLTSINDRVSAYIEKNNKLPDKLGDVQLNTLKRSSSEYEYIKGSSTVADQVEYQLCATFSKSNGYIPATSGQDDYLSGGTTSHKAGRQCFTLTQYVAPNETIRPGQPSIFSPTPTQQVR